jgi:hypothetical protein
MDLYFKLASHGILPKSKPTATWLTMFPVRADGYGLLYQLGHPVIPALSETVLTFPTWEDYPDVYRLAATAQDSFQMDISHGNPPKNPRKAPRLQSDLYLSASKDNSLDASIRQMKYRLQGANTSTVFPRTSSWPHYHAPFGHWMPASSVLPPMTSPCALRPLDVRELLTAADDLTGQLNAFTHRVSRDYQDATRTRHDYRRGPRQDERCGQDDRCGSPGTQRGGIPNVHDKFARNSQCGACGQFGHDKTSYIFTAKLQTSQAWCSANSTEAAHLSTAWCRSQANNPRPAARRFIAADDEALTDAILNFGFMRASS